MTEQLLFYHQAPPVQHYYQAPSVQHLNQGLGDPIFWQQQEQQRPAPQQEQRVEEEVFVVQFDHFFVWTG